MELLSIGCEGKVVHGFNWLDELYSGEFDDLRTCNLYSCETCEPVHPRLQIQNSNMLAAPCNQQKNQDVLQVGFIIFLDKLLEGFIPVSS